MKSKFIISLFVFIISFLAIKNVIAQSLNDRYNPNDKMAYFECKKQDKYYILNQDGEIISQKSYKSIVGFSEGYFTVENADSTFSIVDENGKIILTKQCEYLDIVKNNLLRIKNSNSWFFINKLGYNQFKDTFQEVRNFHNGFAAVKQNNLWGFINNNGSLITEIKYREVNDFANGFALVYDGKYSFINENGDNLNNDKYYMAHDFKENGYGRVQISENYLHFKLIDKKGEIFPKRKDLFITSTGFTNDSLIEVCQTDENFRCGMIDKNENEVIPIMYSAVYSFNQKHFYPVFKYHGNKKCGVVNIKNETIIPFDYSEVNGFFSHRISTASKSINKGDEIEYEVLVNEKIEKHKTRLNEVVYGVINLDNEVVIPFTYKLINRLFVNDVSDSYYNKLLFTVEDFSNKTGLIDSKNRIYIPIKYDYVVYIGEGFFQCKRDGKILIFDSKSNNEIQYDYNIQGVVGKNLLQVEKDEKIGLIDIKGRIIIELQYDYITEIL